MAARIYEFPFTIKQVAIDIMGLVVRGSGDKAEITVDCPFCSPSNLKRGKMSLSVARNNYKCFACDDGGGVVQLYAKNFGIDNKAAYSEIMELIGCNKSNYHNYVTTAKPVVVKNERADAETIHQTYLMLLSCLSLNESDKKHLMQRGLSDKEIVKNKFKSVPATGQIDLCKKLIESGCTLTGVPGFYIPVKLCPKCGKVGDKNDTVCPRCKGNFELNSDWCIKLFAPGIIIPVQGLDGRYCGMQIRLNKAINNRKYIWLSSNGLKGGAGSASPIHFIGDPTSETVFITEGPLKGIVANTFSHSTFICVAGVNNISGLPEMLKTLKSHGLKRVVECYDMDKYTNEQVKKKAAELKELVESLGLECKTATWQDKSLKGVDDYYKHRAEIRNKTINY